MDARRAVVMDNGSGFLKAGLAGGKVPTVIFPAVVGKKKPRCRRLSLAEQYTGEEAVLQRSNMTLRHPVERGVVSQWSDMEMVWEHAYHRLPTTPNLQHVLLTESVLNPAPNRRRTVETFLETLRAPGIFVADTPSLCLYAFDGTATTTALVLEAGYSDTTAVPIVRGQVMRQAVTRLDLGGNDLTVFLLRLVESRGSFFPPAKREMFSEVKEKLCYVAMDYAKEEETVKLFTGRPQTSGIKQSYNLAGDTVTLETERFQCPESLFQPEWLRLDAMGVHRLVQSAIEKCPVDVQGLLYENIVVAGGSTCFPGFPERLEAELSRLCPEGCSVSVHAPESPKTLAWRGGSEFCLSEDVEDKWITLKEYQEIGENVLERKRGIFKVEEEDEGENPDRERTDGGTSSRQDCNSRASKTTFSSLSRTPSRTTRSTTPASSLYKRTPLFSSTPSTPLSGYTTPAIYQATGSEAGRGRMYRTDRYTIAERTFSPASGQSSPRTRSTAQKRKDEVRPQSHGLYDGPHFKPTLPKTPEVSDDEDEVPPLQKRGQNHEEVTDSSGVRRTSVGDFTSFRKMSLFDHLLEEVATFSPRSDYDDNEDTNDWYTHGRSRTSLFEEEDSLPGHGMYGLTKNETISYNSFVKTSPRSEHEAERPELPGGVGSERELRVHCLVPVIEITSCPTPHGSASADSDSELPSPTDYEPRKVSFKFDE